MAAPALRVRPLTKPVRGTYTDSYFCYRTTKLVPFTYVSQLGVVDSPLSSP